MFMIDSTPKAVDQFQVVQDAVRSSGDAHTPIGTPPEHLLLFMFVDALSGCKTDKDLRKAQNEIRMVCRRWARVGKDAEVEALYLKTLGLMPKGRLREMSLIHFYLSTGQKN